MLDFKLAVVGPTVTRWFGIARGCADCAAARPGALKTCQGFGSGCIAGPVEARTEEKKAPYSPA